ncbi:hypothetical protein NQ317_005399 [Molorchus minor]|uniref:Uncharacterized protein n=1 Tax=Molorchus minor TaxID=1323400 RepID=A0ABQ9JBI8_9CUCU|nr:hypothetical protein NQ317_005399 [Molorchus minor]
MFVFGFKQRVWCLSIYFRVQGIDFEYSRSDPSPPDLAPTLPKARTIESIETIPEMIRALPTFPDLSRLCPNTPEGYKHRVWCEESIATIPETIRVPDPDFSRTLPKARNTVFGVFQYLRGIDCDYSRNDTSPSDFSRIFPMPKTTVFGVFPYIFKSKESIATIPEMIRELPTFPDFARTLPKAGNTVFGVSLNIFRCEESIATIPETIRALPTFPVFSESLKPPYEESIATVPEAIRELPNLTIATTFPRSPNERPPIRFNNFFQAGRCVAAGHAVGSEAATT